VACYRVSLTFINIIEDHKGLTTVDIVFRNAMPCSVVNMFQPLKPTVVKKEAAGPFEIFVKIR
jgi:hypothetical protein